MADELIQAVLERHWSNVANLDVLHEIYHEDVVVEYPQSGERIVGLADLRALHERYLPDLTFSVHRVHGGGDLWITEGILIYRGESMRTVTIMEFRDGKVVRETTYVGQSWEPPAWRAQSVETAE